jgi:tetratricopeptide (TPR) repeat protein
MLVIHNDAVTGGRLRSIETRPFRRYAFGSLLAYAEEVHQRVFHQRLIQCHTLLLPGGVPSYGREQLANVLVGEKYDSVMCHLNLDHGGVLDDSFLSLAREMFLKENGRLLNPVKSIAKSEVSKASPFSLETQTAPCVVKKDDNYNRPETVVELTTPAELLAWLEKTPKEERSRFVIHTRLQYFGMEQSKLFQLERWIVVFDDLTVNHRCSNEFYIKSGTSLSFYVRDERRMNRDLRRLEESGYDWKGRSIDCAYDNNLEAWDSRYKVLEQCRSSFHFDYAELDVIQASRNEFVVIDVNQTPGPSYKNVFFRELGVRYLADGLGIPKVPEALPKAPEPPNVASIEEAEPVGIGEGEQKLAEDPENPRVIFQLAKALLAEEKLDRALSLFKKRASMGGETDEERFLAQLEVGKIAMRLEHPEPTVLSELLGSYLLRPTRAEPLYELARFYRLKKNYAMASLFAKAGVETRRPSDARAVVESVYAWQLLDELGSAASSLRDRGPAQKAWETVLSRAKEGTNVPESDLERIQTNLKKDQNSG